MQTVVIFGKGFLGSILADKLRDSGFSVHVAEDRINSIEDAQRVLDGVKDPLCVVNAIGKTGRPNVDWCEDHKEETWQGNVLVPLDIAQAAWSHPKRLPMIHVSSGCIFDGDRLFRELDEPNFEGSYYSHSKKVAEDGLLTLQEGNPGAKLSIHRIRMPFVSYKDQRNLFTKLLGYSKIVNTKNSITSMEDYTDFLVHLIDTWSKSPVATDPDYGWFEILHCVNEGPITHKEIMQMFHEESEGIYNINDKEFISPDQLNGITKTPRTNCTLRRSEKFTSRPTETAVREAVRAYVRQELRLRS